MKNLIAIDLELNQPSQTIIQVGVAVGDITTGQLIAKEAIDVYTKEILDPRIIDLTGITQANVNAGIDITEAYYKIEEISKKYECFINPLTWGGGDTQLLKDQLMHNPEIINRWIFGRRWIDVKTIYVSYRIAHNLEIQGGLARSMTKMGLRFNGRKHNAGDDAANTFVMYHKLLQEFKNPVST